MIEPVDFIEADPPWFYNNRANHKTRFRGGCRGHYDVLKTKEICGLPVQSLINEHSLLALWCTMPMLPEQLRVLDAWGFEYVTTLFTWVKSSGSAREIAAYEAQENEIRQLKESDPEWFLRHKKVPALKPSPEQIKFFFGVGYYSKSNCEICILAKRRSRQKPPKHFYKPARDDVSSLIIAPARAHSQKPWEAAHRIEAMWPHFSKLELFSRQVRPGWQAIGFEIDGKDIREVLANV
jgi:N6-adenosine-specific RNA methylase IME4